MELSQEIRDMLSSLHTLETDTKRAIINAIRQKVDEGFNLGHRYAITEYKGDKVVEYCYNSAIMCSIIKDELEKILFVNSENVHFQPIHMKLSELVYIYRHLLSKDICNTDDCVECDY